MILESLFVLIDHPSNIQDITWNTMQVITLVGGLLGVAGSFFANKYAIEQLKTGKAALRKQFEAENQERKDEVKELRNLMNTRVDASNKKIQDLERGLGVKIDGLVNDIKGIEIKIGENHNALLTALLKKDNG